ncbi:MAG: tail fiber protein [Geobacteraceae bacterium]|nr:tail fiber protein [Geobacteraceae bacterium]
MADPYVAEIRVFPFNFAPRGWAFCQGQLMPISQNTALFSLLGTTYGGDGKSTFALPNLQGTVPMHHGQGPGLSYHDLGESQGSEAVTLISSEMPLHSHPVPCIDTEEGALAAGTVFARSAPERPPAYSANAPDVVMSPSALTPAGGGLPHNNMSPYLTLNFCIALQGVFPPRW